MSFRSEFDQEDLSYEALVKTSYLGAKLHTILDDKTNPFSILIERLLEKAVRNLQALINVDLKSDLATTIQAEIKSTLLLIDAVQLTLLEAENASDQLSTEERREIAKLVGEVYED